MLRCSSITKTWGSSRIGGDCILLKIISLKNPFIVIKTAYKLTQFWKIKSVKTKVWLTREVSICQSLAHGILKTRNGIMFVVVTAFLSPGTWWSGHTTHLGHNATLVTISHQECGVVGKMQHFWILCAYICTCTDGLWTTVMHRSYHGWGRWRTQSRTNDLEMTHTFCTAFPNCLMDSGYCLICAYVGHIHRSPTLLQQFLN